LRPPHRLAIILYKGWRCSEKRRSSAR